MTTPPSDTDRIIAAHRQEAHKTRVLLAWIFIGIPVVGLVAWGVVAAVASAGHSGTTIPPAAVVQTADPMPTGLLNTIDDTTSCAAVTEWATDAAVDKFTGGYSKDRFQFQFECQQHPDELAGAALLNTGMVAPTN